MKLLLFALTGIFVFGAVDSPRVAEARRQWETIRQEVAAGLVPAAKLEEAQRAIDDAADDAILDQTLYGKIRVEDLNPTQAAEMLDAAERRVDRVEQEITQRKALVTNGVRLQISMMSWKLSWLGAKKRWILRRSARLWSRAS